MSFQSKTKTCAYDVENSTRYDNIKIYGNSVRGVIILIRRDKTERENARARGRESGRAKDIKEEKEY